MVTKSRSKGICAQRKLEKQLMIFRKQLFINRKGNTIVNLGENHKKAMVLSLGDFIFFGNVSVKINKNRLCVRPQ